MSTFAIILQDTPFQLWGLSSSERLRRQLNEIGGIDMVPTVQDLPDSGRVLLLNSKYLFEIRTLTGLLERTNSMLVYPEDGLAAAVIVDAGDAELAVACISEQESPTAKNLKKIRPKDLGAFNEALRSAQAPLLEPINAGNQSQLENLLYGNAYRGITDLVTKFLWPRPARQAVHLAARLGLSPNSITTIGLLLVLAACYLFLNGYYLAGLAAGWMMTFLDTVDGKLARVTVQSSKFGHLYDHVIDLVHPPIWYILWGMSLVNFQAVLGYGQEQMYDMIILAYVAGRIVEGLFPLLGDCSVFTWKPFDAYFRLVTARRNPCLIILTFCALVGRPDWGFVAVTAWTVVTTIMLIIRLLQGFIARISGGPLKSWLSASDVAEGRNARAFRIFGSTRSAHGGQ